jgi:serine/threonine protein kinase
MVGTFPSADCPSKHALQAYCRGAVSEDELVRLAHHLETCASCENLLTHLEPQPDPIADALRRCAKLPVHDDESLLRRLQVNFAEAFPVASAPVSIQLPCRLGKYELLELLGGGGMGVVYRAMQTGLQRIVAVKVLSPRLAEAPSVVQRFHEEIRLVGTLGLRQEHLVPAIDAEIAQGRAFLVMEYVDGIDLSRLVRRVGPLSVEAVGEIGYQAAKGLQSLFEFGLVHRDVKPSNLMLADGLVRLLDFGLARCVGDRDDSTDLTAADQFLGTVDYVAPEQIRDPRRVDTRADIYSLGCTLFYLLTGRAPFTGRLSREDKCRAHQVEAPPDIRRIRPDVPQDLADVIMRMLEKDPPARFLRPADVVQSLKSYAGRGQLREVARLSPQVAEWRTQVGSTIDLGNAVPRTQRPSRRLAFTVTALILGAALIIPALWFSIPPATNDQPNPPGAKVAEPGTTVVPRTLLTADPAANSFFQVNEGTNRLHMVSDDLQLVKLGTIDRADAVIDISVEVSELKSKFGEAGIFVGHRDSRDHEQSQFQLIRLGTAPDGEVYSRRTANYFHPKTPNSRSSQGFSSISLTRALRVNTLTLKIVQGNLQQVSWNGQIVEEIAPAQGDEITGNNAIGAFGIYTDRSVAIFSSYHLNGTLYEFGQP